MIEAINGGGIGTFKNSADYLHYLSINATNENVKREARECLITYAGVYVITFGEYKGKSIEEIYLNNRYYLDYLLKNNDKYIVYITKLFLDKNKDNISEYYGYYKNQQEKYRLIGYFREQILALRIDEVARVMEEIGFRCKKAGNKYLIYRCIWGCKDKREFDHMHIFNGDNGVVKFHYFKCSNSGNIISVFKEIFNCDFVDTISYCNKFSVLLIC